MKTVKKSLRNPLRRPTHPGAILREDILPALAISQSALAEYLGVSRLTVSEILLEKRSISAEMALRISKTVGGSPESWLQMQSAVDLWDVTQRFKADPKKLPRPIPNYAFA
jgi:addiction module HigA family antidote